jgi:tetratricopeptide (TPR) repeat protein
MTAVREWTAGTTLAGRYVLVRRVGSGTTGEVWRADDLQAQQPVALKRLQVPQLPVARLEREAALATALQHPNIVRTTGIIRDGAQVCLVQEFIAGGDSRRLRGRPWQSWAQPLADIAAALEAAHVAGLVHLDLTPGNVLLEAAGPARLADFGVATAVGSSGHAPGSPYARSPAQWRGEAAVPADDLYGLGALAYEWLSGHPPYYPDIRAARVLAGPPDSAHTVGGAAATPGELLRLVDGLLSTEATQRPSLAEVRATLAACCAATLAADSPGAVEVAGRALPTVARPPAPWVPCPPAVGMAVPAEATPPFRWAPDASARPPAGPATSRWSLGRGALVALMVVAVVVAVAWQPAPAPRPMAAVVGQSTRGPAQGARLAVAAPLQVPTDPVALARMAAAKSAADDARDRYHQLRIVLEKQPVAVWGGALWVAAQAAEGEAQTAYGKLEFAAAEHHWQLGLKALQSVRAARAPALALALSTGAAALARPDSKAAVTAYGRALAIDPGQPLAAAGLRRAAVLDRVTHLLDTALIDEHAGRAAAAVAGYQQALALDPATTAARSGLARLQQAAGVATYRHTLAEAWRLLSAGQREAAKATFQRAAALQPGATEPAEGLAQVASAAQSAGLGGMRAQAEAAERGEHWAAAEALYTAALAQEPGVSFASLGRDRTGPRARLDAQLQAVLDEPAQALRPALRQMARVWLQQAAEALPPRARLQQQSLGVARLLASAERPVLLTVQSDGLTQVAVLRQQRLGTLTEATLEVLPGHQVIVGTRAGYRDVRREVEVVPDTVPAPVMVRCEERI